ncbi:MAG TPA: prolyl oligopeptidase family serine peptidase [Pseudonocardia sp.]|nr:prolyl oligopeptidase family serine peptidase [Pseudonocardia sp.]
MLVLVLLAVLLGGVGWYYSSVLLKPVRGFDCPDRVVAVRDGEVWLAPSRWAGQPGEWGLRWAGGLARVGPVLPALGSSPGAALDPSAEPALEPVAGMPGGVVRRPLRPGPVPPVGPVMVDAGLYDADPSARGLAFETVPVAAPLGDCPAWFVPATGSTWVIAVHGRGVDHRECLRVLPVPHRLGHPVLAISYRNDIGAPASPDGHYHLGDTEWQDLAASVEYALAHGATGLVLYGWSMGAAIIGAFLNRAPDALASPVRAVVWDSPMLDWRATLRLQASQRHLPPGLTPLATAVTRRRIGIDFDQFDLVRRPPARRPPTLLLHGDSDTGVPVQTSRALAAEATRLGWPLRYVEVAGAEHTANWNVDPARYESAVADFLTEYASGES